MRIVGGKYKGRRIVAPKNDLARPTTDFAKEALFNILQHSIALEGIRVLDLFAGTGGISAEFLSRGADEVISVEQAPLLHAHLQHMVRELDASNWFVVRADAFTYLTADRGRYDLIFADPPFHAEGTAKLPALIREADLLAPDGLLIVEHPRNVDLSSDPWFERCRKYSNIHFSFFTPRPTGP